MFEGNIGAYLSGALLDGYLGFLSNIKLGCKGSLDEEKSFMT